MMSYPLSREDIDKNMPSLYPGIKAQTLDKNRVDLAIKFIKVFYWNR